MDGIYSHAVIVRELDHRIKSLFQTSDSRKTLSSISHLPCVISLDQSLRLIVSTLTLAHWCLIIFALLIIFSLNSVCQFSVRRRIGQVTVISV